MAEEDKEVYKMVMPQFQQMCQSCMLMVRNRSKKADGARHQLETSRENLPIVPESIRKKDKSDYINLVKEK